MHYWHLAIVAVLSFMSKYVFVREADSTIA